MSEASPWSRSLEPDEGSALAVGLGPLELVLARYPHEWRVAARWAEGEDHDQRSSVGPVPLGSEESFDRLVRVPMGDPGALRLKAVAADRPVIAKPADALLVPPGSEAVVFLGTPAWARLCLDDAVLTEFPVRQLSDTWFGPNTREGQLCYASRTQARTRLGELARLVGRVVTRATLVNRTKATVAVSSLGLPMPAMSVFEAGDGGLWTEAVRVEAKAGGSTTHIGDVPTDAGSTTRLGEPRDPPDAGGLVRAFSSLMGGGGAWSG